MIDPKKEIGEILTVTEQVEYVLNNYEHTRENDKVLTVTVWRIFYKVSHTITVEAYLNDLPTQDIIKRIRAKFNSKGAYLPKDPEVCRARKILEDVYTEFRGHDFETYYTRRKAIRRSVLPR
jgi:hypothetical protein